MKTDYIKLAKYLDKIGKYKQADNVEKFIRSAQYSAAPTYQSGGPKNQFTGGYFDATSMGRQQAGFNASLQQGVGLESGIEGYLPLTPQQMIGMSPQDVFNYNTSLGEQLVADANKYTGPSKFQQIIGMISQRLQTATPETKSQIYQTSLEEVISSEISNLVMNGTPQNLNASLQLLRALGMPEIFSRTVPQAIQFGLSAMSMDSNPQTKQRYNQFVNDPTVKQYAPGFSPIQ
jgi:hypothetical protein